MTRSRSGSLLLLWLLGSVAAYAQTANRSPEVHLLRLAGEDVVRCGSFLRKLREPRSLSEPEFERAVECATRAWREGRPFFFSIEGPGIDSYVASGILGMRESGGLYRFAYDSAPCGGPGCAEAFGLTLCEPMGNSDVIDLEKLCRLRLKRVEMSQPPPQPMRLQQPVCEFKDLKLPEDFVVLAAGAYSGREIGFQIDQSGHAGTQIDVTVNRPDMPVVLMLGAYEPTIWNVSWSEKTRIVAVLVSGYHRQALAGLEPSVPTLNSSFDNKGACGYFYVAASNLAQLNPTARRLFQRNVDLVYLAQSGKVIVGHPLPPGEKLVSSDAARPESFYDRNAPIAGPAGLEDAVAKGLLRRATKADAEAWADALMAQTPAQSVPPIAGQGRPRPPLPSLHRAYVVLQPFAFPAGLYGGNSATFLVPKGIPRPTGNPGHSAILDFNSLKCEGALCAATR